MVLKKGKNERLWSRVLFLEIFVAPATGCGNLEEVHNIERGCSFARGYSVVRSLSLAQCCNPPRSCSIYSFQKAGTPPALPVLHTVEVDPDGRLYLRVSRLRFFFGQQLEHQIQNTVIHKLD